MKCHPENAMFQPAIIVLLAAGVGLAAAESAQLDPAVVTVGGRQELALGTFTLQAWSKREAFPTPIEVVAYSADLGRVMIKARPDGLYLHTDGRQANAADQAVYDHVGLLAFTPTAAGTYTLSGRITLVSGAKSNPEATPCSRWAVVTYADAARNFTVLDQGDGDADAVVDLATRPPLAHIALAAGQHLGLTVWRGRYNWYGGGVLDRVAVAAVP